jgi:glyoxylase I family protein
VTKIKEEQNKWSVRIMNLSKIHHIAIIVSDYEAAKDFYVNKLGFSVIRENYRPERKDWKLDLRVNEHTELEIFAEENPPKRVNRPEACGLRHLAFCVESVEQTVNELAEVGIECEPIRVDDYTGKKMTFFHDPDGLPLELHE